ncbi:MAG: FlxA-like family protein [Leptolyngbya sp. SIO1E4]|nr:FlxA-like family protein [Leptolyngbya sp. SIO1E4]
MTATLSSGSRKSVSAQAYILGSLGGVDIRLEADYSSDFNNQTTHIYRGALAQESSVSLLGLASKLGGFTLPAGIPDLHLLDINIELKTNEQGVEYFAFTGQSTLALGKKFDLLGVTVEPPEGIRFTFSLRRERVSKAGQQVTEGRFLLTLAMPANDRLVISSALAWTRDIPGLDTFRELQNDEDLPKEGEASSAEAISLILNAQRAIAITLVDKTLGAAGAAKYLVDFEPTDWALTLQFLGEDFPLSLPSADGSASVTAPPSVPAPAASVAAPAVSLGDSPGNGATTQAAPEEFTFPFLKADGEEDTAPAAKPAGPANAQTGAVSGGALSRTQAADSGQQSSSLKKLSQKIAIGKPTDLGFESDPDTGASFIKISFPATITVGGMKFRSKLPVKFAIDRFAIEVSHPTGLEVLSETEKLRPPQKAGEPQREKFQLFGLEWEFFGVKVPDFDPEKPLYHHFTLVTEDFNYQIQQADGARIEIAYTKASRDPIVFIVEDFAISPKGISLTATVSDRPARLNGIDTQYRFNGSQLRIVDNEILDFTLSGSGPLPPKLVGDAMADISLQFKQVEGNLKLVAGAAKIQGNKILDCKGTRFRFSIDAMGLKFVNDDRFHIYFTLTGSARFVLQSGDDRQNGALSMLPNIQIDLVDCPLTGDASVIAKHVRFLIELPKPVSFPFLGAYEFELRAIGFIPQFEPFGNDVAMQISGQIKFAQGKGDVASDKPDLHSLFIGLPEPGGFLPRLYMDKLPLDISAGEAFQLNGVVEFKDDELLKGFEGEGVLEIQGMPPIAASFGFYRVRKSEDQPWVRAWFIYIEIRQVSFRVPIVEFYIREVGLGFGYRYTLVGIKRADEAESLTQLLQELKVLSRTQGDLSRRDRWAIDVEDRGQDPRWTIVFRAMIAQLSAAPSPLTWNAAKEEALACVYLFDAVIAFRSDLTFFMNVRGWINTSYGAFVKERNQGNDLEPLFSGFVFLWPRQKRFLAHLASNPNGHLGSKPPLPEFTQSAIRSSQFSATLLIEPGLMHFELGWPNMLRWSNKLGPLNADIRGGFIFRISTTEMVIGISFLARASLEISASVNLGLVGASVTAKANAAYGARYIGVVGFGANDQPTLYGAIGLELRIRLSVSLWIKIPLIFKTIRLSYRFSLNINFTAGLEFAVNGLRDAGLRGSGTLSVSAMGHRLQFNVKLSANADAVTRARQRTEKYLNIGLEATEVDTTLPGVDASPPAARVAASQAAPAGAAPAALRASAAQPVAFESPEPGVLDVPAEALRSEAPIAAEPNAVSEPLPVVERAELAAEVSAIEPFDTPDYSVFVVRDAHDDFSYFVLFPRSMRDGGRAGFLPVPPPNIDPDAEAPPVFTAASYRDFSLSFPSGLPAGLQWFNPVTDAFQAVDAIAPDQAEASQTSNGLTWRADWAQTLFDDAEAYQFEDEQTFRDRSQVPDPTTESITLQDYLRNAYLLNDAQEPIDDPASLAMEEDLRADERVQNPSDNAFEAAVRGATEQFRGSPFFKRDPNYAYEQILEQAFSEETTIYEGDTASSDPDQVLDAHQQAHQVRSMVINDLTGDLQTYVTGANDTERQQTATQSVAFQMGLVFRVPKGQRPPWLDENVSMSDAPKLVQRDRRTELTPTSQERYLRTFNTFATDFSKNPPQFQRVKHFTDANTIAITWDLVQTYPTTLQADPEQALTPLQQDPEQNLKHYEVRRRSLSSQAPELVYQVKGAAVLNRPEGSSTLSILKPRFQVVDHFTEESLDDIVSLPADGLSYLYTITPYDFAGNAGHPLTLVATRYPNEPPQVPVDGEFQVNYQLDETNTGLSDVTTSATSLPHLVEPENCTITWTEPSDAQNGVRVPIQDYYLVFRKETTLPIGSYGLDSSTQRPRTKLLPTSNSRALPTDIKIKLTPEGLRRARSATVSAAELRQHGILPAEWQSQAWKIFFQTVSVNQVPSALAPVQLLLRFNSAATANSDQVEERRPAELEWLPQPLRLALLPPEDQRAVTGTAHFPMPTTQLTETGVNAAAFKFAFDGTASSLHLAYQEHPIGIRCIRFRWNQGPSHLSAYPIALTASYDLLELDIDAHTTETFRDRDQLAQALRQIQEVQMLSAADLLLTPGDTLSTNQWEAWYPSAIARRWLYQANPVSGADITESPWYSWRESILAWPEWAGLTDGDGERATALHPFLTQLTETLQETYLVSLQTSPPLQPQTLATFLQSTAAEADPYGWGVLQRFGLTTTFSLRDTETGDVIAGQALLEAVQGVILQLAPAYPTLYPHLHVELLFQAGQSVSLEANAAVPLDGLLGIIQISLRPVIHQVQQYGQVAIAGDNNSQAKLKFDFSQPFTLIDQSDPDSSQIRLTPEFDENGAPKPIERTVTVPLNGQVNLLLRAAEMPQVSQIVSQPGQDDIAVPLSISPLAVTHPLSTYFTADPDVLAADFQSDPDAETESASTIQWQRFKRYAEALNSTDADTKIQVPTSGDALKSALPDVLLWSLRFFNAAAVPTDNEQGLGRTAAGPWLATAYPRADTPAPATPDDSGRLQYDHLLQDKWAHTYRYYIRPNDRYGLLWASLLKSPALFPTGNATASLTEAVPDPTQGGLDVVLDRISPLAMPVILSSARLDPPSAPGQSVPPGRTWEVIIAQHPEQTLMERNQTLARQLQFRQVAFALLRRFAYTANNGDDWVSRISNLIQVQGTPGANHTLSLKLVEDYYPDSLPTAADAPLPDHLDFQRIPQTDEAFAQLTAEDLVQIDADLRSIDLPLRLGNFQQGALVLQWDTLPFFYQHQLLVVAQSDRVVSPVNSVIHKDFEYRSPIPSAWMVGQVPETVTVPEPFGRLGSPNPTLPSRRVRISLRQLWDSLPQSVRDQWPSEAPNILANNQRTPSALPDLEVVYQLVQVMEGNIEVQVETFVEQQEDSEQYQLRQLGKFFLGNITTLEPPTEGQTDYGLNLTIRQVSQVPLQRPYDFSTVAAATRDKLAFSEADQLLQVLSVFTQRDRDALWLVMAQVIEELRLLLAAGLATEQTLLNAWYASRMVTTQTFLQDDRVEPVSLPNIAGISYEDAPATLLLLKAGSAETATLQALADQCDARLQFALRRLLGETSPPGNSNGVTVERSPDQSFAIAAVQLLTNTDVPSSLQGKVQLYPQQPDQLDPTRSEMIWLGSLSTTQEIALRAFIFNGAVNRLKTALENTQVSQPYTPPTIPAVPEIPADLAQTYGITASRDGLSWTLQWTGELTAAAMVTIHDLLDDAIYPSGAIALFRKVLAGQKAYAAALENAVANDRTADLITPIQAQINGIQSALDSTINPRIAELEAQPSLTSEEQAELNNLRQNQQNLQASIQNLEGQIRALEAAAEQRRREEAAVQARLAAALVQFDGLTSPGEAAAIPAVPASGDFLTTPYTATVLWRVTLPVLVQQLRSQGDTAVADWLEARLTIPTEPIASEVVWRNLYVNDAGWVNAVALQTPVQSALETLSDGSLDTFKTAFDALTGAIEGVASRVDYRPYQGDLSESLQSHLIVRGQLLRGTRSLNETERGQLRDRFSALGQPSQESLQRLFIDLQDRQALDRLYRRWWVQVYLSATFDLGRLPAALQAKVSLTSLPEATHDYALIWQGAMTDDDETTFKTWRKDLEDSALIDALDELLQRVPRPDPTAPVDPTVETIVLGQGSPPTLPITLESQLRLGPGAILRYHGLMTLAEANDLREAVAERDRPAIQPLFNLSMTQSLQGGELSLMSRRGSAKPSDLERLPPFDLGR